ncbi:hypothetical protein [Nocardia brasiliensis]|nr:hypothetical protein [Nocardia brasiliensis]
MVWAQSMGGFAVEAIVERDGELAQLPMQGAVVAHEGADAGFEQCDERE